MTLFGPRPQSRCRRPAAWRPHVVATVLALSASGVPSVSEGADSSPFGLADPAPTWDLTVGAIGRWGSLDGFVQVPRGGAPGTSSAKRPTLDELGIDDAWTFAAAVGLSRGDHGLVGGISLVDLDGSARTRSPFVAQAVDFTADTPIESSLRLSTYSIGYEHRFAFDLSAPGAVTLSPGVSFGLLDFGFSVRAPSAGVEADRSYLKGFAQLGVELEYQPSPRWQLTGSFAGAPPIGTMPIVLEGEIAAAYRVLSTTGSSRAPVGLNLELGVGWQQIEFRDGQPNPNHTKVDYGPLLLIGLELEL